MRCSNYEPKQVYISTANIHSNDFFDAARYALGVNPYDAIKDTLNNTYGVASIKEPKKVIFNDPATIVFWHDGTKTVVKAIDEPFDPEKGLAMAIAKKHLGNKHEYYNVFKKHLKKYKYEQMKETFANVDEVHESKEPIMPSCFGVAYYDSADKCKLCWHQYDCKQTVTLLENAEKLNKE